MLVFFDGQRFRVEASSQAIVDPAGTRVEIGSVRRLEPVPAMVEIPPLARPSRHAAADRIRHEAVSGAQTFELYPRDSALLIEDAYLRFTSTEGPGVYRVEVIDSAGREVYAVETTAEVVKIPEDKLTPGAVYFWRISSRDRGSHGGAFFRTLSAQAARTRRQLAEQSAGVDDPGLHLLLAEVDRGLGLRFEACDTLLTTPRILPAEALERALRRFDCGAWTRDAGHRDAGRRDAMREVAR